MIPPEIQRLLDYAEESREVGHYGAERKVTDGQALESYQWAGGFRQAV